jgi:flagellar biosynthesis component FlhA
MYKPSLWFVTISLVLITTALLAGTGHLLVPVAGSGILLGYGYSVVRKRRKARSQHPASREAEAQRVEQQRYLLAKEAILDGAKRKRLRKQS